MPEGQLTRTIINLPQTVEIHSPNPNDETTSTSLHTANIKLGGSESNPIDVDLIPDHLMGLDSGLQRSRSALIPQYCRTCMRYGHTAKTCIWDGPIVCQYCMEIGHGKKDCQNLRRDQAMYTLSMKFCMFCGQGRHTHSQCALLHLPQPPQ